MFSGLNVIR